MSQIVECFTFQISKKPFKEHLFFQGHIYDYRWLVESVKADKLLPAEGFELKWIGDYVNGGGGALSNQ